MLFAFNVWVNYGISSILDRFTHEHQPALKWPSIPSGFSITKSGFPSDIGYLEVQTFGVIEICERLAGFLAPDIENGWVYPLYSALDHKIRDASVVFSQVENIFDIDLLVDPLVDVENHQL